MALSMEERRILAEIETRLSEDDPRLAHRFAELGTSPPRSRRGRTRIILAAAALALTAVAAVAAAIAAAIT